MRLVSPLLKHVIYPGLSKSGYLRTMAPALPAVLTYHGVFPDDYEMGDERLDGNLVSVEQLRSQLRFFKDNYELISPEDFLQWCARGIALPPRALLLTCDDGLRNNLTGMLPVLREFAVKCLFFVTGACAQPSGAMLWHEQLLLQLLSAADTCRLDLREVGIYADVHGRRQKHDLWRKLMERLASQDTYIRSSVLEELRRQLGLSNSWISDYEEDGVLCDRFLTMNLSQLRQLAAAGMCIGAHSVSHPKLSEMSPDLAASEIRNSGQDLSRALGEDIWAFAYPFGDPPAVSTRDMALAEECGFACAFMNVESQAGHDRSLFAFPRVHVTKEMNLAEIDARISGFHASLSQLRA
jgi:peptidoglycan/xylan/chitin deacetylase (PgdA/CDA1 family)